VADFSHLPVASSLDSLVELLSSPRSNEEIQLELVEILGFEGAGLQLVEDILKPGTRSLLVDELSADHGSRTASQVGSSTGL
jgi:antiviral helicase SLH1